MKIKKLVLTVLTLTVLLVGLLAAVSPTYAIDLKIRQNNVQSTKCVNGVCETCVNGVCRNFGTNSSTGDGEIVQKNIQSTNCENGVCETVSKSIVTVDGKTMICTLKTIDGKVVEDFCTNAYDPGLELPSPPPCLTPPLFGFPTCLTEPTPPPLANKAKDMFKGKDKIRCELESSNADDDFEDMIFGSLPEKFVKCINPCAFNEYIDPCKPYDIEKD